MQAGISIPEGFMLLAEDERDTELKNMLQGLHQAVETGAEVSSAFRQAGVFPAYMVAMLEVGEQTGHLDSVFKSLSAYYDRQVTLTRTVKSAVVYPAILFLMMLAVIAVLVVMVLPIFDNVFEQLGQGMSPIALVFMNFGLALADSRWYILAVLIIVIAVCLTVRLVPRLYASFSRFCKRLFSHARLSRIMDTARFTSAMAMTFSSGMDVDSSLEMSQKLCAGSMVEDRAKKCRKLIEEGASFADAIAEAELFDPMYCRMLSVGVKTGAADSVMEEIARRGEEAVEISIEKTIGKVEPTLVIIMSLLVGLVLLSVMLPLMGIMSSIG